MFLSMLGIDAVGIRKVIKAPSRYAIPLIVSTGLPLKEHSHRNDQGGETLSFIDRYPFDEIVFDDEFGSPLSSGA